VETDSVPDQREEGLKIRHSRVVFKTGGGGKGDRASLKSRGLRIIMPGENSRPTGAYQERRAVKVEDIAWEKERKIGRD